MMKYKIITVAVFAVSIMPCYTLLLNKIIPESLQLLQPAANSWSYPANSMGIIYSQPAPYEPTVNSNVPIVVLGDDKLLSLLQQEKSSELEIQESKFMSALNPTESQFHSSDLEKHSILGRDANRMTEMSIQSLIQQLEILNSKISEKHQLHDNAQENTSENRTESNILKINRKGSNPKINPDVSQSELYKSNRLSNKISASDMFTENPKLMEYEIVTELSANSKDIEPNEAISDINEPDIENKESGKAYMTDDYSSGERNVRHLVTSQSTEVPQDTSSVSTPIPQARLVKKESFAKPDLDKSISHKNEPENKLSSSNEEVVEERTTEAQDALPDVLIHKNLLNKLANPDADIDPNSFKSSPTGSPKQTRELPLGADPVHDETVQSSNSEKEIFKSFTSPVIAAIVPNPIKREHSHAHGTVPIHENGKNYILTSSVMKAPTPFGGSVILYNTIVPPEQYKESLPHNKRSVYGLESLSPNPLGQLYYTVQDNAPVLKEQEGVQFLNPAAIRLVPLPLKLSNSVLSNSLLSNSIS